MSIIEKINQLWYYDGHLNEDQRDFLIEFLSPKKVEYCLEIGFATGRSTVTILETCHPKKMVSIDKDLDYMTGAREHANKIMMEYPILTLIEGDSQLVGNPKFMNDIFPEGIDFGFIDGGHTEQECYSDISNTYSYLRDNGFLIVDDYYSGPPNGCSLEGVNNAVCRFYRDNEIIVERWYKDGKGFAIIQQ